MTSLGETYEKLMKFIRFFCKSGPRLTTVYFLIKIEHHCNLQTILTPFIGSISQLASIYIKRILKFYFKRILKSALKHATMTLMSSWQRLKGSGVLWVQNPDPWTPGPRVWTPPSLKIYDPQIALSYFAHCIFMYALFT